MTDGRRGALGGAPHQASPDAYPSWPIWGDDERGRLSATLEAGGWWTGDGDATHGFARSLPISRVRGLFGVWAFIHAMRYGGRTLDGADTDDAPLECQAHQVGRVVRGGGVVQDMAVMRIRGAQTRERCPSIS